MAGHHGHGHHGGHHGGNAHRKEELRQKFDREVKSLGGLAGFGESKPPPANAGPDNAPPPQAGLPARRGGYPLPVENYDSIDDQQHLHDYANVGNNPEELEDRRTALNKISEWLDDVTNHTKKLHNSSGGWQGDAAEQAMRWMASSAKWTDQTSYAATQASQGYGLQSHTAADLKKEMPPPNNFDAKKSLDHAMDNFGSGNIGKMISAIGEVSSISDNQHDADENKQKQIAALKKADQGYLSPMSNQPVIDPPPDLSGHDSGPPTHHGTPSGSHTPSPSPSTTSAAGFDGAPASSPSSAPSVGSASPASLGSVSSGGGGGTYSGSPGVVGGVPGGGSSPTALPPAASTGGGNFSTPATPTGRIGGSLSGGPISGAGGLGTSGSASSFRPTPGVSSGAGAGMGPELAGGALGGKGGGFRTNASRFGGLNEPMPEEESAGANRAGARLNDPKLKGGAPAEEGTAGKGGAGSRLGGKAGAGAAAEEGAGQRASNAAGAKAGSGPGGAGAGAGKGKKGEDDKEHEDKYGMKEEMDDPLVDEEKGYAVDPTTGDTVTKPVIGE